MTVFAYLFVINRGGGGVHPGRVELASPNELTTSRVEVAKHGLAESFQPVLSLSCAPDDMPSREMFNVFLEIVHTFS